jgi:hypothetical protein
VGRQFTGAIIAAGSQRLNYPVYHGEDPRVMDSTDVLELGGGSRPLAGLAVESLVWKWRSVYQVGSEVTVVELTDQCWHR